MIPTPSDRLITRRLMAAEGYLELGLPALALDELESLSSTGRWAVAHRWLVAESLCCLGRNAEALPLLELVVEAADGPLKLRALQSLSICRIAATGSSADHPHPSECDSPGAPEAVLQPAENPAIPAAAAAGEPAGLRETNFQEAAHVPVDSSTVVDHTPPPLLTLQIPSVGKVTITLHPQRGVRVTLEKDIP